MTNDGITMTINCNMTKILLQHQYKTIATLKKNPRTPKTGAPPPLRPTTLPAKSFAAPNPGEASRYHLSRARTQPWP
jgi:hypothetical protein